MKNCSTVTCHLADLAELTMRESAGRADQSKECTKREDVHLREHKAENLTFREQSADANVASEAI